VKGSALSNVPESSQSIVPAHTRHIHILGICGTAMAALAGMLLEKGFTVTGSDSNVYPPMSDFLLELGVEAFQGYRAGNLDQFSAPPDLVVVGNVIRRDNPEAARMRELGLPSASFPQVLSSVFISGKQSLVVAGTHGKTTTSSLLAWILESAGLDPSFMIGGIAKNFMKNYKVGQGGLFVAEGDEYDTAYFDKGPKFLHYQPRYVILTGVEFDHADIYRDLDHIKSSFRKLLDIIPDSGALFVYGEDEGAIDVASGFRGTMETYGPEESGCDWTAAMAEPAARGKTRLRIAHKGTVLGEVETPLAGRHNMLNTLSAVALCATLGVDFNLISRGVSLFQGVKRRQEVRGVERGVTVIDDFAHHPTEVRETVAAMRKAYPSGRLIAVFEPRTNTSRQKFFQNEYVTSFEEADYVLLREPPDPEKFPPDNRFSSRQLAGDLRQRGIEAFSFDSTDGVIERVMVLVRPEDTVLVMSNGGFDNIHNRLLKALAKGA